MNKLFIILLTFAMVLNLAAYSTKSGSSDNISEETDVVDSGEPEVVVSPDPELDTSQEPEDEVDPLSAKFNGLWITASSIGTLYFFDNGEVTTYSQVNYDPPPGDLRYTVVQKQNYMVEEVTSQAGSGHKAVLENGNVYWLLDEYPDQLSLFWYDEDGRVHGQMTKAGSNLSAARLFSLQAPG